MGIQATVITLEKVGPENLSACGIGCITSPDYQGYQPKVEWLLSDPYVSKGRLKNLLKKEISE